MNIDTANILETAATLLQSTGRSSELSIEAIRAGAVEIRELRKIGRAVVDARYYHGDDGWDRLKQAIGELEGMVGRS